MISTFKPVKNAFLAWKRKVREPSSKIKGFLSRELYPFYQQKQMERWESQGSSEGGRFAFPENSPGWRKAKIEMKKKYGDRFPGGEKRLTWTGNLAASVIGDAKGSSLGAAGRSFHRKAITNRKLTVATTIPYGMKVVDWMNARGKKSFMKFSQTTHGEMRDKIRNFLKKEFGNVRA